MGPFLEVFNGKMMFKYHMEISDNILCDKLLFFPWFLIGNNKHRANDDPKEGNAVIACRRLIEPA